jgi:hypothetical protein
VWMMKWCVDDEGGVWMMEVVRGMMKVMGG